MTIPWLSNCGHSTDSWCLDCTMKLGEENWALRDEIRDIKANKVSKLYYESHITIDPAFDERRNIAAIIANKYKFKLAHLILRKCVDDLEEQFQDDTFMTSQGKVYKDIMTRTTNLIMELHDYGFVVRRYKIEDTIEDSKLDPSLLIKLKV